MKKTILISLIGLVLILAGCTQQMTNTDDFVGVITEVPPEPFKSGYCFTSDSGKYNCSVLGDANTSMPAKNLEFYVGKKVKIHGQDHIGAVNMSAPVDIDLESIDVIK
ncbi:MAG: hypothetical protein WCT26_03685 [Candidatus Buchananbacteria bacterium]|jgi:hypothetical protein